MSPEQEAKIRGYATAPYGVPGLVALAQVELEHSDRLDLLASLLDRDGGPDPIGPGAEPLTSSVFAYASATATSPALTNDGTIDVRAIADQFPHQVSYTRSWHKDECEDDIDRYNRYISGTHSRPRVRDDLAEIVRNPGSSVHVVDRILDRLAREPSETSGFTRGYANGEWSRRNIEMFIDDVKSGRL